jgi:hypothetical protein
MRKSGYKTSEFWFTVVSFIFSGLYLLGIIGENQHKEELIEVVSHAVESIILISGQVIILIKYIKGRQEEKLRAQELDRLEKEAISNDRRRKKPSSNNSRPSNSAKSKQSTKRQKSSDK